MKLKIIRAIERKDAYDNIIRFSSNDMESKVNYGEIARTIYKFVSDSDPKMNGCITVPQLIRTKHNLAFDDVIDVKPVKIIRKNLSHVKITIKRFKQKNETELIHEDTLTKNLVEYFHDYYIFDGQSLLYCDRTSGELYIVNITSGKGFVNSSTVFDMISLDYTLNIVSPKKIKSDIFDPNFNFESIGIGGLSTELKEIFKKALSLRAINPDIWAKLGIRPVKGILLYGPPGCGKTLTARNISSLISQREPKIINGPDILNKYVGQSEENLRNIFNDALTDYKINGNNSDLHVIIFDEIDAICKTRGSGSNAAINDNLVNQLLTILQGVNDNANNFFVIGMTNRMDMLDPALLRAGRLEVHIEINLPNYKGRCEILRVHTEKIRMQGLLSSSFSVEELALSTENFTGAELNAVVNNTVSDSAHSMLSDGQTVDLSKMKLSSADFIRAISTINPMFGKDTLSIQHHILPTPFTHFSQTHENYYSDIMKKIETSNGLLSIIICGKPKTGKTVLLTKIATEVNFNYCKYVKGLDIVNDTQLVKSDKIQNIFTNAHLSTTSLLILDDAETLMEYSDLGSITFSSKMYHVILTNCKQHPIGQNKLVVILCCSKEYLFNNLKDNFMHEYFISKDI